MRLIKLELKNIGPFIEEELEFISEEDSIEKTPVVIITGENRTEKTVILDAIRRLMIGSTYISPNKRIERHIIRKVFVCTSNLDHAKILDETETYSNQTIDEILLPPLFGSTQPFNQKISCLLK